MTDQEKLRLAYTEALAQLRLHPSLIWTRANFFLLVDSGLVAFAVSRSPDSWPGSPLVLPIVGIFLSSIWIWVNVAGQRLQRQWRKVVIEIEEELFRAGECGSKIDGPLTRAARSAKEGSSLIVSITTALIVLSISFVLCWLYFLLIAARTVCGTS